MDWIRILPRPVATTPGQKLAIIATVLAVCTTVPYLISVPPSVSLSYVAQFSNRACSLLFVLGAVIFAVLTGGELAEPDGPSANRPLRVSSLILALCFIALMFWAQLFDAVPHAIGLEANYNLNRLQMLVSGLRPYRDFEYIYGPMLIYGPYLLAKLFHITAVTGYYLWWVSEWIVGTWMLWFVVQRLSLALRWRTLLFWCLFIVRFAFDFGNDGIAYTPFRTFGAAFWIMLVYFVWTKTRKAILTVLAASAVLAIALGTSSEQALGVSAALLVWFGFLYFRRDQQFPLSAWIAFAAVAIGLFAVAASQHVFYTTSQLSKGAYSFPLLPSAPLFLFLIVYLFAPCAVVREFRAGNFASESLPLTVGGLAMIPAALGRCDMGHLVMAFPAFVLGCAYLLSHRFSRIAWGSVIVVVTLIPIGYGVTMNVLRRVHIAYGAHALQQRWKGETGQSNTQATERGFTATRPGEENRPPQSLIRLSAPCPVIYRTPNIQPPVNQTAAQTCLDTGYYLVWVDAFTSEAMERKIRDLDHKPRGPILLYDIPLDQQLVASDYGMGYLNGLEFPLFLPKERRTMPNYKVIADYIGKNYVPDPQAENGMRVWRPKQAN